MKVLDLFCGAGGASTGYSHAGYQPIGVDLAPQPAYPYEFHQGDWRIGLAHLDGVDLIHASPPCQGYSPHVTSEQSQWAGTKGKLEPRLIEEVRAALELTGRPYVIENVVGAKPFLRDPILVCGVMFGLPIARHRLLETSLPVKQPWHPDCRGVAKRFAAEQGWEYRDMSVTGKGRHAGTLDRWKVIMGWPEYRGSQHAMREAIPPAYGRWLGDILRDQLAGPPGNAPEPRADVSLQRGGSVRASQLDLWGEPT